MRWIRAPGLALNQTREAVLALFLFTSFAQLAHVLNSAHSRDEALL